jgi:uncharacterized membrane protein
MVDREVKIAALSLVSLLAIVAIVYPTISAYDNSAFAFSELAVLGPGQSLAGYPRQLVTGQTFLLYAYIENHEGNAEYYQVLVKLGNQSTSVSNSTAANAPVIFKNSAVLLNNQSLEFPIYLSISNIGLNQRLIFELWIYDMAKSGFSYTGIWNQIWINVTLP